MTGFPAAARRALHHHGYTLRAAARAIHYDAAYLSRVLSGRQSPSRRLAEALDRLLSADGALIEAALPACPPRWPLHQPAPGDAPAPGTAAGQMAALSAAIRRYSRHDIRYGSDQVADVAVRLWRDAQHRLDTGLIPARDERAYLRVLAEAAQLAGWQLFDAGRAEESRLATLEAVLLARQGHDHGQELFGLALLAAQHVECHQPRAALRLTDELLTRPGVPPRVTSLARALQGWAHGLMGDHRRALTESAAARAAADRSFSPRDPVWSRQVGEGEFTGFHAHTLLAAGRPDAAAAAFHRTVEWFSTAVPAGRGVLHYRISLVTACAASGSWDTCASELTALTPLLSTVRSAQNRRRLRQVCLRLTRDPRAPAWLTEQATHTARLTTAEAPGEAPGEGPARSLPA